MKKEILEELIETTKVAIIDIRVEMSYNVQTRDDLENKYAVLDSRLDDLEDTLSDYEFDIENEYT